MSEQVQIYVSCYNHPKLCKPQPFKLSHRHEYAPPAIEAYMIVNAELGTKFVKRRLSGTFSLGSDFANKVQSFSSSREKLLRSLRETPEIISFLNYVFNLEAEVETELEMEAEQKAIEEIIAGEVEEVGEEPKEEIETIPEGKVYDNLLDAISDAVKQERKRLRGKSTLEGIIRDYVQSFLDLTDWLVDQRLQLKKHEVSSQQLQQLIADLITFDVMFIADEERQLGSEKSLVIPLDLSPLRISLALQLAENLSVNAKNWTRMFCPPVLLTLKDNVPRLLKPYRTLDKHPIMMRIPIFDKDPERFQQEVERALKDFREHIDPLIGKLKGLTPFGKRGTPPSLIKNHLSKVISIYMDYNPFCIENFRVMDLGCGDGALLRDVYRKLLEARSTPWEGIFIYTLLNDIIEEPGKSLRSDSQKEDFINRLELDICQGDMRDLIEDIHDTNEHFDMAFINRVFDIYGGYGVFIFDRKDLKTHGSSLPTVQTEELVPPELGHKVVAFSGVAVYNGFWRAIRFLMGQSVETSDDNIFLPAVHMDALNNFFTFRSQKGLALFKKLLGVAELVFISVFPGNFDTLFPLDTPQEHEIFEFELPPEPNTYSVICISRNKLLSEHIASKWREIT